MQNELAIYDAVMRLAQEYDTLSGTQNGTQLLLTKVGSRQEYIKKNGVESLMSLKVTFTYTSDNGKTIATKTLDDNFNNTINASQKLLDKLKEKGAIALFLAEAKI